MHLSAPAIVCASRPSGETGVVVLLLTAQPVSDLTLEGVADALHDSLNTDRIVRRSVPYTDDGGGTKHFVVATASGPSVQGTPRPGEWVIDVAVWQDIRWRKRFGSPGARDAVLRERLSPSDRRLIRKAKAELHERGLKARISTSSLCEAALDGRLQTMGDLDSLLDPGRGPKGDGS